MNADNPAQQKNQTPPKKDLLRHASNISRRQMVIFVLVFSLVGFLIYKTFAAGPLVASLQAEQMSLPVGGSVLSDTTASAGQAVVLANNGTATGSINFASPVTSITVNAKGDQCGGSPTINVLLDGKSLLSGTAVSSSSWTSYSASPAADIAAGTHTLNVSFTNAYTQTKRHGHTTSVACIRKVYLDVTNFYGPLPTTPQPTVTLTASPSSLTAGQAATLSWNSTNATSCNASGAWSGSQPTSGSTSTGALNQNSTYTLTCSGAGGIFSATAIVSVAAVTPPPPSSTVTCNLYASTGGSDSNGGSQASPFRTVQRLVNSLSAGATGCLMGGTFVENVTFSNGGSGNTSRIILTTAPGYSRATINGVIYVSPTANYVTLDNLKIDATNASQVTAVQLFADYGRLTNSDIYGANQDRIGSEIGYQRQVTGVEVDHNRIHNFGILGSGNIYDHGIYINQSSGALIHDNYIYDNMGGYGIQLWEHAQGSKIYNNTIDGNGAGNIIIAGASNATGSSSSNNEIYRNILSNPYTGNNTVIFWSNSVNGTGNTVHDNVTWNGSFDTGNAYGSNSGVSYTNNTTVDPQFVNRANKDFSLQSGSPATGYGVGTSPTGGTSSSGTITSSLTEGMVLKGIVHWTATVPAGAQSVEFWADNTRLSLQTAGPYAYDLNTTNYANGAHIVGVAWTDSNGVRYPASPAVNVTISN